MSHDGFMCKHCGRRGLGMRTQQICSACSREHYRLQARAGATVANAVRRGHMQPAHALPCMDCAEPAHHYDHRDYRKPLDVDAVCRGCNTRRGVAMLGPHG